MRVHATAGRENGPASGGSRPLRAGLAASGAVLLLCVPPTRAAVLTGQLTGWRLDAWNGIMEVVRAADHGEPAYPTLQSLFRQVDSSVHEVRVVIRRPTYVRSVAGRFRIEKVRRDGRCEASLLLDLETIDRASDRSPGGPFIPFGRLGRTERYAKVLAHELAHAVWTFANPARIERAVGIDRRMRALARQVRVEGAESVDVRERARESERLVREFEKPALEAEAVVARELRSRSRHCGR